MNVYLKPVLDLNNQKYYHILKKGTNEHIGNCGLRLEQNKENNYLGNIEYEIFEQYRGQYYSKEACLLLADIAYSSNLKSLIVTANIKNNSSIKIIESLGAKFLKVEKVPKKCRLYKQGDRKLKIYEWNIDKEMKTR